MSAIGDVASPLLIGRTFNISRVECKRTEPGERLKAGKIETVCRIGGTGDRG
jgi:hypothetical protein